MRRMLVLVAMFGLLAACELPTSTPMSNGVAIKDSGDLTIAPGSLGPAKAGMTKREALDTGLFSQQKFDPSEKCKASALKWKKQYKNVEVHTDAAGTIRSLRVVGPGAKTQFGTQVGSDLADVRGSYSSALHGPSKRDRIHSVGFVQKGDAWMGFLFEDDPDDEVLDPIAMIELTKGTKPQLRRTC
ncbi:MAG TPA: hypothetical protein VM093_06155 [Aeromicrobium sp.]|nr:hypothetical protein [Aeromicrobium sp.]